MNTTKTTLSPVWAVLAIIAGISTLMMIELIEDPDLTLVEILYEAIQPTLIVLTVTAALYLLGELNVNIRSSSP